MTITPDSFRTILPAFADTTKYPDTSITFWLAQVTDKLDPLVWGTRLDEAAMYYVAHNLVLSASSSLLRVGAGVVASKSVGPGSVSYDNALSRNEGAGSYNLTIWGQRYWELVQMAGAGGAQINPAGQVPYGTDFLLGGFMMP